MREPSFFETVHAPYYICIGDYNRKAAGIRAMYFLCNALNQLGQEAYIVGSKSTPDEIRAPLLTRDDFLRHQKQKRIPIVVYPEVVSGNAFQMPHVVRWLLNKPGLIAGDETLDENEMVYVYTKDYTPQGMSLPLLSIPVVNHAIFHNENNPYDKKREGNCFYANKYLVHGGKLTEHAVGAKSLCQDVNLMPQEIADILRRSELLYCYEPSAIIGEALLCGCPVVIIPSPYLDDNLSFPIQGPGIASTPSEKDIAYAKDTIDICQENNVVFHGNCWFHVRSFIENTQDEFAKREELMSEMDKKWGGKIYSLLTADKEHSEQKTELSWLKSKLWLQSNGISEGRVSIMAENMVNNWQYQPSFHLIMVINAGELDLLSNSLDSLQEQLYKAWGLTILSNVPAPEAFADVPDNIEWLQVDSELNRQIDQSVAESGLDWIIQLLPGDKLAPHALLSFAETANTDLNTHLIYADEVVDESQYEVWFKPDFNLELLRSQSYLGRAVAVSRQAFEVTEGYSSFAYVAITDMAFKVVEQFGADTIQHIPEVLYTANPHDEDSVQRTVNEIAIRQGHLMRCDIPDSFVKHMDNGCFKVHYPVLDKPLVSIVIANRNQATPIARCLEALPITSYPNYEVVVVDCASDIEDMPYIYDEAEARFGDRWRLFHFEQTSDAAAVNYGVEQAQGDMIVVMSPTTMVLDAKWLDDMMSLALRPDVAVVGVRVIDNEQRTIHAGGVLALTDDLKGLFHGEQISDSGYMHRAHCVQEYASVSSACYMVKKADFQSVGGLDESALANTLYSAMDFCLKQQQQGLRVVWTPYVTVIQDLYFAEKTNALSEPYVKGLDIDEVMLSRWTEAFRQNNSFNPNLSLRDRAVIPELKIFTHADKRKKFKTRVMMLPINQSGTGEYRGSAVFRQLEKEGEIEVVWLPSSEFQKEPFLPSLYELNLWQPDVIFVQQLLSDVGYAFIKMLKEKTDIKVIFSIDDLVHNLPSKNSRKHMVARDMRHRLHRVMALSDVVVVSTEPLAQAYAEYSDNIVVIPNSLESERWTQLTLPEKQQGSKPRVGWAGAAQHLGDLDWLTEVVKALADQVDWVFMGMCPDEMKPYVKEVHPFVPFNQYPQKLADLNLDLALAPLEQHPFNESKSNLRLLEYGVLGWPVIASDIEPFRYMNPPVTRLANDAELWIANILALLDKPEEFAALGKTLQGWVQENFFMENHKKQWLKLVKV